MWQQYQYVDTYGNHSYFVYTPEIYQVGIPVPLVVMLHGCTQTAADFATGTAMNLLAEQHGFILLYPQQMSTSNYKRCWNWFLPVNQQRGSGEPARIVGMVKSLLRNPARWRIDPARIYAAGLSAGACMTVILGTTYPDLFAAIGIHSGLEYQAAMDVKSALQTMRRGGPYPQHLGHFPKQAGTVTGLVGAAGGLGGFFPPLIMGLSETNFGSYALGYVLLAIVTVTCLGVAWLTLGLRRPMVQVSRSAVTR